MVFLLLIGKTYLSAQEIQAYFTWSNACNPNSFWFFDESVGEDINSWYWEFGDGYTSVMQNPVHTFMEEGTYIVCLTVFSEGGYYAQYCDSVYAPYDIGDCNITIDYIAAQVSTMGGSDGLIDITVSGGIEPYHYLWNTGDTVPDLSGLIADTYCITVTDAVCCTAEECITITEPECQADFVVDYDEDCGENCFHFIDISPHDNIVFWFWDYGDGSYGYSQDAYNTYEYAGDYNVCLSIFTSDSCVSTYCLNLHVENNLQDSCEAYFTYLPTENPNIIEFTDNSYGDIISWSWDFEDGTVSYEKNPVHTFYYQGEYKVCLTILTSDSCSDTYCETLYVPADLIIDSCQAHFTYEPLSAPNGFKFYDNSIGDIISWFWDFGDGFTSILRHPEHTYADSGMYNVCLTIETIDGCADMYCEVIVAQNILNYYSICGLVYAKENLVPGGMMVLFRRNADSTFNAVDYTCICGGEYCFEAVLEGDYLLYAIPYFDIDVQYMYPVYFPTYFGDKVFWNDAEVISLQDDLYDAHIYLEHYDHILYGNGKISGDVTFNAPGFYEEYIYDFNWFDSNNEYDSVPNAARNMTVLLLNEEDEPVSYLLSGVNGLFGFNELELMTYRIYTEKAGMITHPANLSLSQDNNIIENIHIILDNGEIVSYIEEDPFMTMGNNIDLYPVPARDILNISLESHQYFTTEINIINSIGQSVKYLQADIEKGKNIIRINVKDFPQGIYFIQMICKNNRLFTGKFIH